MRDRDPDFYRGADSMEYGKTPNLPEENIDKMVAEMNARSVKLPVLDESNCCHTTRPMLAASVNSLEHFLASQELA